MIPRSTLAGAIGNTVEWFDFAVYGYFAKEIGEPYFPADVPSLQLLSAFAVFAVGYLMRPIGGLLIGADLPDAGSLHGQPLLARARGCPLPECRRHALVLPPLRAGCRRLARRAFAG